MREPTAAVACSIWRRHGVADATRIIPEEAAIAFTYDGCSYAVMMALSRRLPSALAYLARTADCPEGYCCSASTCARLRSGPGGAASSVLALLEALTIDAAPQVRMFRPIVRQSDYVADHFPHVGERPSSSGLKIAAKPPKASTQANAAA
jgi:hypothetical protein